MGTDHSAQVVQGKISLKKILYISYDGMTDPLGQSQVLPYLAELSKKGYCFTILSFEKKNRYQANRKIIEQITAEASINWVPLFFTSRPPVLSKLYDQWRLLKKAFQLHKKEKYSIIHCRSYIAAAAGLKLKRKKGVAFLFDMRGFWVDERVDNGQWNLKNPFFKLVYRLYKKKENRYLQYANHIISLTHKGKDELVEGYAVSPEKITVIPCCVDLGHFDYTKINDVAREKLKEQLGIHSADKVLSYLGSLGGWYLTEEMLDFYKTLKTQVPGTRFLFITHDSREGILAKAAERGIESCDIITRPAKRDEVPLYLSLSDWSIFFIKDAYSKKASSPTKQGEIMAMGIPIICNDIGDTGFIINSSGAGIVVKELTTEQYTLRISEFKNKRMLSKEKIREAAALFFDLSTGVDRYEATYSQLLI